MRGVKSHRLSVDDRAVLVYDVVDREIRRDEAKTEAADRFANDEAPQFAKVEARARRLLASARFRRSIDTLGLKCLRVFRSSF